MSHAFPANTIDQRWPRLWRMFLIGLSALILCSCRGPAQTSRDRSALDPQMFPALPQEAYTGEPGQLAATVPPIGPPGMEQGVPLPYVPRGPWSPPGIRGPWPEDEYLCDGGDRGLPAEVGDQWEVRGLELADTIAHYDTLGGRTVVEPTNRIEIYSPRFGAVRQVVSLVANEQARRSADMYLPATLVGPSGTEIVASSKQNVQTERQIGAKPAEIYRRKRGDGATSNATGPRRFQGDMLLHENLKLIREGIVDSAEMAWLAHGVGAAVAWSHKQAVQVILDHQAATAEVSDQNLASVYTIKEPPGEPKLRVVKVASTPFAEPGDDVAFTIRFDNIGNQVIGNVTIIDSLTTRLEYVPDSAQCSVDAEFSTQPNQGDSLVLRCEITDPLPPGKGGVIRFRCRVR